MKRDFCLQSGETSVFFCAGKIFDTQKISREVIEMKRFLAALIIVGNIFFASTVCAEIQTYKGVGEYLMTTETIDFAKNQAELVAQRDILERVAVYVKGISIMIDNELDSDEIITISAGVLHVTDTKFLIATADDGIIVTSFVIAEIDIDELKNLLEQIIRGCW